MTARKTRPSGLPAWKFSTWALIAALIVGLYAAAIPFLTNFRALGERGAEDWLMLIAGTVLVGGLIATVIWVLILFARAVMKVADRP